MKNAVSRHPHQRQDVWTFPEGSSIMAQNGGSLVSNIQAHQNDPAHATQPENLVSQANKGILKDINT